MADIDFDAIHWQVTPDGHLQPRTVPLPIGYPDPADVKRGVVYGYANQFVGTMDAEGGSGQPYISGSSNADRWFASMIGVSGAEITYSRGAASKTIYSVLMRSEMQRDEFGGTVRVNRGKDFVVRRIDIESLSVPKRNDVIVCAGVTYRVIDPAYQELTADGSLFRVHAQE